MRVLVACEFSGIVRDSFKALGHDAWSCVKMTLTLLMTRCDMSDNLIPVTIDIEAYAAWWKQQTGQSVALSLTDKFHIQRNGEYIQYNEHGYSVFGWCSVFVPTRFLTMLL